VEANAEIARKWFERGASQDNAASYNGLGLLYLEGLGGLEKDQQQAIVNFKEAASRDHGGGLFNLAEQYLSKSCRFASSSS
jgi:SEL1 protein